MEPGRWRGGRLPKSSPSSLAVSHLPTTHLTFADPLPKSLAVSRNKRRPSHSTCVAPNTAPRATPQTTKIKIYSAIPTQFPTFFTSRAQPAPPARNHAPYTGGPTMRSKTQPHSPEQAPALLRARANLCQTAPSNKKTKSNRTSTRRRKTNSPQLDRSRHNATLFAQNLPHLKLPPPLSPSPPSPIIFTSLPRMDELTYRPVAPATLSKD